MKRASLSCNPVLLERYLAEVLTAAEDAAVVEHLSECSECRECLKALAAEPSTWDEAVHFLPDQPYDSAQLRLSFPGDSLSESTSKGRLKRDGMEVDADVDAEDSELADHRGTSIEISEVLRQLDPTDDPSMLGRLGGYEVSGVVGSGGMGVVLKGFDRSLDRTVAIKVLAPRLASSGAARRRFAREARAAATVLHPNVIVIHGVSNDGTLPFLVMPYLRGESLQRRLNRLGPLATEEVVRIAQQIAAGLSAAHGQGLVHRDIKPANILLEDGVDRVTITDFGLARAVDDASMTRSGVIAGTPQYMSPEQARGDNVDARSDLFSLGSVMYAMCTGHPPFRAESSYGILRKITDTEPRSIRELQPQVPDWLERIISGLLSKCPDERFGTSVQVADLLQQCVAHLEQPGKLPLPGELLSERPRIRRKTAIVAVSLLTFAAVGFGAWKMVPQTPISTAIEPSSIETNLPGWRDIDDLSDAIDQELDKLEREGAWDFESSPGQPY